MDLLLKKQDVLFFLDALDRLPAKKIRAETPGEILYSTACLYGEARLIEGILC